jgi:hypothetical protein
MTYTFEKIQDAVVKAVEISRARKEKKPSGGVGLGGGGITVHDPMDRFDIIKSILDGLFHGNHSAVAKALMPQDKVDPPTQEDIETIIRSSEIIAEIAIGSKRPAPGAVDKLTGIIADYGISGIRQYLGAVFFPLWSQEQKDG